MSSKKSLSPALNYSSQSKIEIKINSRLKTKQDLSLAYTPGIAEVSRAIQKNPDNFFKYTFARNNLAVISDGSAVLGMGNIGPKASYPIMEGKSMLFKRFGNIDAIPIVVNTQDVNEFVDTVKRIADSFAAINLEDISAPRCFAIEGKLKKALSIPIMHDDQHGTAVVVLAALLGALKLTSRKPASTKITIVGSGAAGTAVTRLLANYGFKHIIIVDSNGIVSRSRRDLNPVKKSLLKFTNPNNITGSINDAAKDADVFIGVSKAGLLTKHMVKSMNQEPIIFAMANPNPEILPKDANAAGAAIIGTGRSDFPNQVNNALAFPGIFRGAIDSRSPITEKTKLTAANAIVDYHKKSLSVNNLLPSILDPKIHAHIARKVRNF